MSTLKAAGIVAVIVNSPPPEGSDGPAADTRAPTGWDPLEVWRTRVLLPRLEQGEGVQQRTDATPTPFLVRSS